MLASLAAAASTVAVHHGRRFGLILLALLVIGGLVFLAVRLGRRRQPPPQDVPARPVGATPSAPPAAGPVAPGPVAPGPVAPRAAVPAAGVPAAAPPPLRRASPPRPSDGWAVETHGLTKRFGSNVAVDDVELLVPRGCAFGYLGPNGAGKTTLIRTLLGLTHANAGTMRILDVPVPAERHRALARVGAIVDEPRFHPHLSGAENLLVLAAARGEGAKDRIAPSLERVGLAGRADDRVSGYSMGMRQRLGVAACLLGDPELLILDEPMNGLDPAGMQDMRGMIHEFVAEGRTVMLSSHLLDEVERTCESVAIVDRGRVIRQGTIDELVRSAGALSVRVGCSDPARATALLEALPFVVGVATADDGAVAVTLAAQSGRPELAELNRQLVEAGFAVHRLEEARTTLEDWFLSVTGRLGDPS